MPTSSTYLYFDGTCEEAFTAYAGILDATIEAMMKTAGSPMEAHMPPGSGETIMHARMRIGDAVVMASDCPPENYRTPQGFNITVGVDDPAEADRIYAALAEGGTQTMPIAETFWAHRFGMCVDRFGTPWMVNCDKPMG